MPGCNGLRKEKCPLGISEGLRRSGGRSNGLPPSVALMARLPLTLMVFVVPGWISSPLATSRPPCGGP